MTSILEPLMRVMGDLMAFFYAIVPSYTIDIILLTVLVMSLLTPLTIKGTRSMIAAQKLAPEIKKLQGEYKNDRQALSEATMALYKEHGVSPVGGCLPLLIQLPFFFAIDYMLRGLSHTTVGALAAPVSGSLLPTSSVHVVGAPKYVPKGSGLYKALVESTGHLHSFGLDLDKAFRSVSGSVTHKAPYLVLVALSVASQYYAQRQISRRNPQAAAANPQMQTVTRIMPLMYGVFSLAFPAGLVVYFVASGAVRIIQQWAMYRFDPKLAEHVKDSRASIEAKVVDAKTGAARATKNGATARSPRSTATERRRGRTAPAATTDTEAKGRRKPSAGEPSAPNRKPVEPARPPAARATTSSNGGGQGNAKTKVEAKDKAVSKGRVDRPPDTDRPPVPRPPGRQQPKKSRKGR
jgi:YidC/Oxa1 family membrane protein insertase